MNLDSKVGGIEVNASIECLTPEQQLEFRKAESIQAVRNLRVPRLRYDAMTALEQLILIEHSDKVDAQVKERIKKLREVIKRRVAEEC